jgi:hypothetical protein
MFKYTITMLSQVHSHIFRITNAQTANHSSYLGTDRLGVPSILIQRRDEP